jgi:two-component system response regulator NreC
VAAIQCIDQTVRIEAKEETPLRVLLVDDHAIVRAGLRLLVEHAGRFQVVAEAGDARAAIFEARAQQPDVIVLDVTLPGESGIEAAPKLLQEAPAAKIVVLSMHDDPRYVHAAFRAGARGYVLKEAADSELLKALETAIAGGQYVNPELGARLAKADAAQTARSREDTLSTREHEVLQLIVLGHTNQEIARSLFISVRTAETHRAHIMQKLRLTTRAELVRYALEHGLLDARASA